MAAKKMPKPFVKAMEKQFPKGATITPAKGKALFGGKETKAEEAKEKKAFPGKSYAKAEAKFEPKGKPFKCGGKVKKYAEGGLAEIGDVEEGKPAGGRFSEDTYARARAFAKAAEREEPVKVSKPARAAAKPEPKEEVIQPRAKATQSTARDAESKDADTAVVDRSPTVANAKKLYSDAERDANFTKNFKPADESAGANKYRDQAIGAALGAIPVGGGAALIGKGVQAASKAGAPIVARAAQWASPAAATKAVSAAREAAPTVAARTKELVMADRVGPKAADWASRASANKAVEAKRAAAVKGNPAPKSKAKEITDKSGYRESEKNIEFKRGGAIRGTGMARPKKTRFI